MRFAHPASLALVMMLVLPSACQGISVSKPDSFRTFVDTSSTEDADGDGYSPSTGDCDDTVSSVYPTADETMGDGVDSNCDGEDDT